MTAAAHSGSARSTSAIARAFAAANADFSDAGRLPEHRREPLVGLERLRAELEERVEVPQGVGGIALGGVESREVPVEAGGGAGVVRPGRVGVELVGGGVGVRGGVELRGL